MLHCPADGQLLLRQSVSGMAIATCERCHGLWLTKEAVATGGPEPVSSISGDRPPPSATHERAGERQCPECACRLQPERVEGVEIDRCVRCSGIWLDAGEYARVRAHLAGVGGAAGEEAAPALAAAETRRLPGGFVGEFVGETVLQVGGRALFGFLGQLLDGV